MPKTILIMRHAKSSWSSPGVVDHQRPLNKRGLRDAPVMGQMLVEQELVPDVLMFSSAKRTEMTAKFLAEEFSGHKTIGGQKFDSTSSIKEKSLYHAPPRTFVKLMHDLADLNFNQEPEAVMFLAHNPGVELLIEQITGHVEIMPTAAVAWIKLPIDTWAHTQHAIDRGDCRLVEVWRPKTL